MVVTAAQYRRRACEAGQVKPEIVIFDVGQVLVHWHPEAAFEQVLAAEDVPPFMERVGFDAWNLANDPRRDIIGSTEDLASEFPADAAAIRGYRQHFLRTVEKPVAGTAGVVAELIGAGVRTAGLTNWSADMFELTRQRHGVLQRLSDIVVSGEEDLVKPDPAIFRLACRRFGVEPHQAVFVDDRPENVAAAVTLGMTGHTFTSASALRRHLVELGLLAEPVPVHGPLFHLAARQDWEVAAAAGRYQWSTSGRDHLSVGFVHCSFAEQVATTWQRAFPGVAAEDLALLEFDPAGLPVVVEDGPHGSFPHLFAELPMSRTRRVPLPET